MQLLLGALWMAGPKLVPARSGARSLLYLGILCPLSVRVASLRLRSLGIEVSGRIARVLPGSYVGLTAIVARITCIARLSGERRKCAHRKGRYQEGR